MYICTCIFININIIDANWFLITDNDAVFNLTILPQKGPNLRIRVHFMVPTEILNKKNFESSLKSKWKIIWKYMQLIQRYSFTKSILWHLVFTKTIPSVRVKESFLRTSEKVLEYSCPEVTTYLKPAVCYRRKYCLKNIYEIQKLLFLYHKSFILNSKI